MQERELKAAMVLHGDTIQTLAEALSISQSTMCAKLKGQRDFWRSEIDTIRDRYQLTPEDVDRIFFADEVS